MTEKKKHKVQKKGKIVKYSLHQLWPENGNLRMVLPVWFKGSDLLRKAYPLCWKYHKGQLAKLSTKDSLHGDKRRRFYARRLFAIRLAFHEQILEGARSFVFRKDYDPFWRAAWRTLNCQPAGGKWLPDRFVKQFYCNNPWCPWCWMRRHDLLYRAMTLPTDKFISGFGKRPLRGMGFVSHQVNCLSFKVRMPTFYEKPGRLNEFCAYVTKEARELIPSGTYLRTLYPLPEHYGAVMAYYSDQTFEGAETKILTLNSGMKVGMHVTPKPVHFSRLMASRMMCTPEFFQNSVERVREVWNLWSGRNLHNIKRREKDVNIEAT